PSAPPARAARPRRRPRARTSRGRESGSRPTGRACRRRRSPASARVGGGALRGEALAAPGPPALENRPAGARGHAGTETVLPLSPAHVGLIGPFHESMKEEEPPGRRAASGKYRQRSRGDFSTEKRTQKRPPKEPLSRGCSSVRVARSGKTVHTCGEWCGGYLSPCKSGAFRVAEGHRSEPQEAVEREPKRCSARSLARPPERPLPAAWSPKLS